MARPAPTRSGHDKPARRRLRVFAFDPGVRAELDNLSISELTLDVLWEDELGEGPSGQYVEVIDYDPASKAFYAPVKLDDRYLLAQDGVAPAEGLPQFHQQMVYAVAMNTIDHFERALGRVAMWADRIVRDDEGRVIGRPQFVPRLRIYPHALREANAYYSPKKKALLFGYFPTPGRGPGQARGGIVFTCLSYDVVAHETTHALLDGLHPSFNEATNIDVHALHEGFADIVALFQRFAHPEILEHVIAKTRGDLEKQNMLGQLARQFGLALGMRSALRDALGHRDTRGQWVAHTPDEKKLQAAREPHERGGILLAAVFSAFLAIYKIRSADLFRIASNGTGVLTAGEIHPDLVRRLAREAASAADTVLTMCIRGLDYCPPVDVDFGTYLRGVVTADAEVYPQDDHHFRDAFIEAFRKWGIYPEGVRSMSDREVRYPRMDDELAPTTANMPTPAERQSIQQAVSRIFELEPPDEPPSPPAKGTRGRRRSPGQRASGTGLDALRLDWDLSADRKRAWRNIRHNAVIVHNWLTGPAMHHHLHVLGLTVSADAPRSVYRDEKGLPAIEVHSVRVARRRGPRDTLVTDIVVEVRQRRRAYFDPKVQARVDAGREHDREKKPDFRFRRGCTLIIDPDTQRVHYVIRTRGDVTDAAELERVRKFVTRGAAEVENAFYGPPAGADIDDEHFAVLHRHHAAVSEF
ncbi:MAG TPA: hypothetical protein VGR35_03205 [Tepidisphaeraceae bacterium]|nr:hypothetical protein [Tepidisphaeraceae bacterium]